MLKASDRRMSSELAASGGNDQSTRPFPAMGRSLPDSEGIRVSARFCVSRLHSFKYRRYDTTLAGGVSHRMAEKQTIQARRAGTSCLCRPSGPLAAVQFANGGLHRRLGLCRPSGPKIALLQYLRIELA